MNAFVPIKCNFPYLEDSSDIKPLCTVNVPCSNKTFTLIQDTWLPAGTKQRGISFFRKVKSQGYNEIVTYGTVYGYGQVATAWCCREVGLLCTIFLTETYPRTKMTREAINLGASVIDIGPDNGYPTNAVLAMKARKYAEKEEDRRMVELGLDDPDFIQSLAEGISEGKGNINPKRLWVAGGSGVLSRALSKAFPETELCIVQVGRKIYPDVLEGIKHKLYVSPEPFRRNAEVIPPYTSLRHYDAKIWRFVRKYGEDGDYIWNVK